MRRLRFILGALTAVVAVTPLSAQQPVGAVRGRVVDESNQQPIARATVGAGNRAVLSGQDGTYLVTLPAGSHQLTARMIGYAPATRTISLAEGQTLEVEFTLAPRAVSLSEIVVTGYGEQRAGDITGAVSSVSAEEFNVGRIVSAAQLISAKTPGVQVVDNNEPGGGLSIRIRGATSINASNEPLYIVDGMPVGGTGAGTGLSAGREGLNFLNPSEIENITVLRDASAAAIYGSNAANGVVIITTRGGSALQGRMGSLFEYTSTFSTSSIDQRPSMLNAAQYRDAVQQHYPASLGMLGTANTDWFDEISQGGFGQEHNLSVTTAAANSFYRLSVGYLNQDGIVRGTNVERVTLGLNYHQVFFNRLDIRVNAKGSRADDMFTPGGVLSNAAVMGPTQPVTEPTATTGYFNWILNTQTPDNPVEIASLTTDRGRTWRALSNVQADWRLPWVQGLRANVNMGFDVSQAERRTFQPSNLHRQQISYGGEDYRRKPSEQNSLFETYLNYTVAAGPGNVDATAGYSYAYAYGEYPWYQAQGLVTDVLGGYGITPSTLVRDGMDVQESKLISFFGRVNYNIRDRYLMAVSLRRDGSSRFGANNTWATFPSVSVGWRLSEEPFLRGSGAISDLKLRAGWATTGNQAFGNYRQYSTYTFSDNQTQVPLNGTFYPTIRPSAVDPNIKWEETRATNFGLDIGLWNQVLTGSVDYYTKSTEGLIFEVPAPAGTNYSNYVYTNVGDMKNSGIELGLYARLREGRDRSIGWSLAFNASHNSNELTTINPLAATPQAQQIAVGGISGGVGSQIQILRPGEPINSFYVYEHRYNADGSPVYNAAGDTAMYVDQNGDGRINQDDRRPYHDPAPKWIVGFSNYLTYGRFNLDFTLRAYMGNYVYNNVASQYGNWLELSRGAPYNLQTSVLETDFATPQLLSDHYVEDASFLRMDNITLAYRFNYQGNPMRVFGIIQNAFTLTGYSGVDPTAGLNGIDNNLYPRSRTFTAGLTLQF